MAAWSFRHGGVRAYQATRNRGRFLFGAGVVLAAGTVWALRHVKSTLDLAEGQHHRFGLVYSMAFLILSWQTLLAYMERPHRVTNRQAQQLNQLNVVVQVPVYNEDPEALRRCLDSLFRQSRMPQMVFVVDDGSNKADYLWVENWAHDAAADHGIELRWERQANAGKRHAQARTFRSTPQADIYLTVDSDAILDRSALEEGLKPFRKPDIMSVAGVVLSVNSGKNLLTRIADLWFVVGQMTDRSSLSTMGAVLVNSGPLALYRAGYIRDNVNAYTNETFFGRRVEFSDDSMLTIYALQHGRAVQQPTAFAFCLMPETFSHHINQYLRWMRGAFIRSFWRFKYLPLDGYAFWAHVMGWVQMAIGLVVFVALFVIQPFIDPRVIPAFLIVPVLVGYAQALRYLSINRDDITLGSQILTFALTPLACLWAFFGLRVIRWYAMATCLKTGSWGTRDEIEVRFASDQ